MAIERVQRRAARFILKCDLSYPERLVKLGLLPLDRLSSIGGRFLHVLDLRFFFKCVQSFVSFKIIPPKKI